MTLLPGFRLVVAPHFHLAQDWTGRLALGAGVEQTADGLVARPPWQPPSAEELSLLLLDPTQVTTRADLANCVCLWNLPAHLRMGFWNLLARAPESGTIPAEGFDALVAEIGRFLAFKEIPAPSGAGFDLVVTRPGPVTRLDAPNLWGLFNLGEDAASVVFVNLPAEAIPSADYPSVRLLLGPGEGLRLPAGMLLGPAGGEEDQPSVWLVIHMPDAGGEAGELEPGPIESRM